MRRFQSSTRPLPLLLALTSVTAWGQASIPVQPTWQPVSSGQPVQTSVSRSVPTNGGKVDSAPYFFAPSNASGGTYIPMTASAVAPSSPVYMTGPRAIIPSEMIPPMVNGQLVQGNWPGLTEVSGSAPTVPAASIPSVPSVAPLSTQPPTMAPAMPTPAPANPVVANPAPTVAPQPFSDPSIFAPGSQSWMDVDISQYVARFPPSAAAEKSVREWILLKTPRDTWYGGEVASLVVTPDRVRVYHSPAVHEQIRTLLGRFANYTPGEFETDIRILSVRSERWRQDYATSLRPAGLNGTSGRVWAVDFQRAAEMISQLDGKQGGRMLAVSPRETSQRIAMNGQRYRFDWSPVTGRQSDPRQTGTPTEDGILVDFSPLIDTDAATVELDINVAGRKEVAAKKSLFGSRDGDRSSVSGANQAAVKELCRLAPNEILLVDLGTMPAFDDATGLFGRDKSGDVLVFIQCRPTSMNRVVIEGREVPVSVVDPGLSARGLASAGSGIQKQVSARPLTPTGISANSSSTGRSTAPGKNRSFVPSLLTQSVD